MEVPDSKPEFGKAATNNTGGSCQAEVAQVLCLPQTSPGRLRHRFECSLPLNM